MSNAALVTDDRQIQHVRATATMTLVRPKGAAMEFDPHPLLTVLVAMGIAFVGAAAFVGSIILWLSLRHSGVMAP
ncbi:MAG TPA: hypothetical protein VKL40_18325 [Candidatus Angelobacter sp.]|nr:hypothetical protein [Candidatus Angelobacter sp.]